MLGGALDKEFSAAFKVDDELISAVLKQMDARRQVKDIKDKQ